jgi:hypothetical protein
MENRILKTNRKLALIAGFSLLLMAIVAGFAYGYVFQNIYVANNGVTTLQNLNNSEFLFRLFLYCFIIVLILDILVSCTLYLFFKQVNKPLSLLTALFRLIYSGILGVALLKIMSVSQLLNNVPQNEFMIMTNLKSFMDIWSLGLILFGCHLFSLSLLVFKSKFAPNLLGVLILLASICYIITNAANLLMPNYANYKETIDMVLSMPMALGELVFAIWLVFKGGKDSKH